jgi:hypothetical protein
MEKRINGLTHEAERKKYHVFLSLMWLFIELVKRATLTSSERSNVRVR